jgi:hypothetical protein
MAATPGDEGLARDAVASSVRVVENAVELARAEVKLLVVRARHLVIEAVTMGLGAVVAVTFVELTLILAALSPLFIGEKNAPASPWPLIASLAISLGVACAGGIVAWLAWRRFRAGGEG